MIFKFWLRKQIITIKRNYFIIPLLLTGVGCFQILNSLNDVSTAFSSMRVENGRFASLFLFVICLLSTLAVVAYMNYAFKKYGEERPVLFLVVYYVLWAITFGLLIANYVSLSKNFDALLNDYYTQANLGNEIAAKEFYDLLPPYAKAQNVILGNIIIQGITVVAVITAPFIQNLLNKIKFERMSDVNAETVSVVDAVKESEKFDDEEVVEE